LIYDNSLPLYVSNTSTGGGPNMSFDENTSTIRTSHSLAYPSKALTLSQTVSPQILQSMKNRTN
jgi:hypothetical protein